MAKQKVVHQIPFDEAGNQLHYPMSQTTTWKDNYQFPDELQYISYARGRSAAYFQFESTITKRRFTMFLTDFDAIVKHLVDGKLSGTWTFCKRGENFGVQFVSVLFGRDLYTDKEFKSWAIHLYTPEQGYFPEMGDIALEYNKATNYSRFEILLAIATLNDVGKSKEEIKDWLDQYFDGRKQNTRSTLVLDPEFLEFRKIVDALRKDTKCTLS
jgi:hypothetical protein